MRTTNKTEALKAFKEIQKAAVLKKLIEYEQTISSNPFKFFTKIIDPSTPLSMISHHEIISSPLCQDHFCPKLY